MSVAYDFTPETAAAEFLRKPHQLLIDGHRVPSSSGRTFKSLNPATEDVIATIAEGNEADVDRAVAAARRVDVAALGLAADGPVQPGAADRVGRGGRAGQTARAGRTEA